MSNKKSKPTSNDNNNENLCPLSRKRNKPAASTPHSSWKIAKLETASSPSALTNEYLEEMGIGMLDSEESSSSAASAIALAVSTSTDENSNEATPNLDAAKFCHQRMTYLPLDNSLDISTDNASNSFIDPNDTLKGTATTTTVTANAQAQHSRTLTDSERHLNIFAEEMLAMRRHEQQETRHLREHHEYIEKMALAQHKKVAILGVGAGIISAPNIHNSNSNSPSAGRSTRSPLATVACNSYFRNAIIQQQQVLLQQQQQHALSASTSTPHAVIGGTTSQNAHRSHSPSLLPSTSQQALIKQQRLQAQQQQPRFVPNDNFFLFRNQAMRESASDGIDHLNTLSDEILLQIFKWLPKKTLIRLSYVCRRFNRCTSDESLWARLDLGSRALRAGALENILTRGVVILRLAQSELNHPVFEPSFLQNEPSFESKLQYLDLSMVSVTKPSLKMLLSRCCSLKKLSLEHVPINDEIANEIAKNTNLEGLNLAMCDGLEAWSVRKMVLSLQNLSSLNISWTNLSVDAVTSLVTNITPNLMRLNVAGCRKTMFDSHLSSLTKRCPQLLELDLSDCTGLTGNSIGIICKFKMLEYLSLSRCYQIPASSYMDLSKLRTLTYLDVFGMLSPNAMEMLEENFPSLGINKFIHSSVARPTVGTRRTSIWGLRTRD